MKYATDKEVTGNPKTAVFTLEKLLAQTQATHEPGKITVIEEQVKVRRGFCRVAVVVSTYGTHIEIGPMRGMNDKITWTFRESELDEAQALLNEYLEKG